MDVKLKLKVQSSVLIQLSELIAVNNMFDDQSFIILLEDLLNELPTNLQDSDDDSHKTLNTAQCPEILVLFSLFKAKAEH